MKKNKIAIYIRITMKKQAESLEFQRKQLEEFCELNGYTIYNVYVDENNNKKAYQEMMEDMKNRKFNKIIVTKLNRISRSVADIETFIQELKKNNCSFESVFEKYDLNSLNDYFMTINLVDYKDKNLMDSINGIDDETDEE